LTFLSISLNIFYWALWPSPTVLKGSLLATETKNETKREIQVEVPADAVAREVESTLLKYQKVARLPGFRRGKVPPSVLRQRFGEDMKSEVIEALVPKYFRKEAERQGLVPVSQPQVTDLDLKDGGTLRFKASFEVLPDVEIVGYQELRPEPKDTSVSDQEVDQALDRLRDQHATYSAVEEDRGLADGDFAQVELNGNPKEKQEDSSPIHLEEVLVNVGGEDTLKEFSENLQGAKAGEQRTFDVTYPEDFTDRRLAGKQFTYTLSVKAIKRKQLPELTDAFAKEVGAEFETADDLRNRIRENMEQEKTHRAEHEAKEKMLDELVRRNEFPVPETLVEHQIDVRLERGLRALAAQGMRTEDMRKMDFPRLRAGQRDAAVREVKTSLILERIAEAEKIEVGDEELNKEIEMVALQSKQPIESVRARLTHDGALDRIRTRLRNEKTLDFLYRRPA
jgi:trigger factor